MKLGQGRNEEETIEACIRSLCDQTWPNLEILVVDDASEDETHRIVAPYFRDGRVRYLSERRPVGPRRPPRGLEPGARAG